MGTTPSRPGHQIMRAAYGVMRLLYLKYICGPGWRWWEPKARRIRASICNTIRSSTRTQRNTTPNARLATLHLVSLPTPNARSRAPFSPATPPPILLASPLRPPTQPRRPQRRRPRRPPTTPTLSHSVFRSRSRSSSVQQPAIQTSHRRPVRFPGAPPTRAAREDLGAAVAVGQDGLLPRLHARLAAARLRAAAPHRRRKQPPQLPPRPGPGVRLPLLPRRPPRRLRRPLPPHPLRVHGVRGRRRAASAPSPTSSPRPSRSSACRPTEQPGSSCRGRASWWPWRPCSSCRSRSPPPTSPWPTRPAAARSDGCTSSTGSTSKPRWRRSAMSCTSVGFQVCTRSGKTARSK